MKLWNNYFNIASLVKCSLFIVIVTAIFACKKNSSQPLQYYEVGMKSASGDWRDSSFIVATSTPGSIKALDAQLTLPVAQRKMVFGRLVAGSGGYNKNASHEFAWHFKEDDWQLAELTAEIYDGQPHSDVDVNINYWVDTVKRFAPWQSYVKRKLP